MSKSEDKRLAAQAPDPYAEARTKISEWEKKLAEGWIACAVLMPEVDMDVHIQGQLKTYRWSAARYEFSNNNGSLSYQGLYWRPIPPAPEPAAEGMTEQRLAVLERTNTNWAEGKELCREVRRLKLKVLELEAE